MWKRRLIRFKTSKWQVPAFQGKCLYRSACKAGVTIEAKKGVVKEVPEE